MKKRIVFIAAVALAVLLVSAAQAAGGVKLDAAHFPDPLFRAEMKEYDENSDGTLSAKEIAGITNVYVNGKPVTSLKGIEYLSALQVLNAADTDLSKLDLSGNPVLRTLQISDTNISSLDLTNNPELTWLYIPGTNITALDVSCCPKLRMLSCGYTGIKKLDLSNNHALEELYCSYSNLTSLDLKNCRLLWSLRCAGCKMTSLSLKNNIKLKTLDCDNMGLTSLNVSALTALESLWCDKNDLSALNVSKNTALTLLSCWGNRLTGLDLSKNTALKELYCRGNQLTKLDLKVNTKLESVSCENNALMSLALPKGTALKRLYCENNRLDALTVSGCTGLNVLNCPNNKLTKLDLSKNKELRHLNCRGNKLTSLKVSGCAALEVLDCTGNDLTELNVAKCTRLYSLSAGYNRLAGIDLSKNTNLQSYNCYLDGNSRNLTAEAGKIFFADLGISGAKVTNVKGATKSSTFLTASKSGDVTYDYKARSDLKVSFTLKVTYIKGEISSVTIAKTSYPYTGKAIKPAVTVKSKIAGRTVKLSKGTQYKVYYKNNVVPGTATITVKGTGHFTGTLTKTFKITKVKLGTVTLSKTTFTYTGHEIKPKVTVKAKVDGVVKTLEKGVDYTVSYKNNVKKGTATVTVKGIGNFTGTITKEFKIK